MVITLRWANMDLTLGQQLILDSDAPRIGVCSCAASAKTATLTEKVRRLLQQGVDPTTIAVITFTNLASAELIERLKDDYQAGLFVGTIHSLAAQMLARGGYGAYIDEIAEEEEFDKFFEILEDHPEIVIHYDWVIIDEAQDTGVHELQFIFDMIDPPHFFCCYDTRQTIYQFAGSDPAILKAYLARKQARIYSLNENFRNSKNILNFAKRIIRKSGELDNSVAMRQRDGQVIECTYDGDYLMSLIKSSGDYSSWAILTRTNAQLSQCAYDLHRNNIPYNSFKQSEVTLAQMEQLLKENKVKLLTIHSSKGLAFDKVIVRGAVWWGEDAVYVNYVAATRARDLLIWTKEPPKRKR